MAHQVRSLLTCPDMKNTKKIHGGHVSTQDNPQWQVNSFFRTLKAQA